MTYLCPTCHGKGEILPPRERADVLAALDRREARTAAQVHTALLARGYARKLVSTQTLLLRMHREGLVSRPGKLGAQWLYRLSAPLIGAAPTPAPSAGGT